MKKRMKAIFCTDNPGWCSRAPMGWTYVLVNDSGLVKFGKSVTSLKERARQIYGYPDFYFVMAFSGVDLETKFHRHFDKERCCYIPLGRNVDIEICDYKTKKEVDVTLLSKTEMRYRKTRKELFKLTYSGSLVDYLHQELNKLGYIPIRMESPDDVLPFDSKNTQKVMANLVSKMAAKKLKCKTLGGS
ncbi:hypothetical protein [Vibrio parahaemolyticus]|uniref:hypothetical protein n=1 Tax=Vibrio parahaemolyticus TaxID=670 RepID=UPI001FAD6F40|nr:hypothetical protein [Vibrio parahaemolyticus]